ncbi:MAG: 16S rRNA processing protein RimM [Firmicutes bacterium]|nr:16S rRNA processing protein RimM [Bacillota bacterium]
MKSSKPENNTERVLLGKIVGAQGIRGEVKIYAFGDAPSDFTKYEKAFLVLRNEEKLVKIEKARIQGNLAVVKFVEIADRNAAEELRDAEVFVEAADLEELPEDTYYVRDLEGLCVIDDDTGEDVGVISEVIQNAAQDVYRIVLNAFGESEGKGKGKGKGKGEGGAQDDSGAPKEALVPAVKEFIKSVDLEAGTIRIHFIEGMR